MAMLLLRRTRGTRPGAPTRRPPHRRCGQALGQNLVHAFALLGLELGFELGKRTQGFLLHIGAQLGELIDQPIVKKVERKVGQ